MSIRRTFKLKVNQVLHRPHSTTSSVNSTLDLPLKDTKLSGAYEHVYQINPSNEVDGLLLPGEITVGHAKEVISYVLHDENRRGISGLLVCTNFRLMFVTDKPPYCNLIAVENKLIGPQDVTLSNIETIYIEKQNGKRKKLYTTSRSIKDGIQKLEIHCKDFRILTYSFKFSVLGEGKNIVRAILHHSYPQDSSLSFAMEYISKKPNNKEATDSSKVVLYRKVDDWEKLIMTSQAMKGRWRVTTINQSFSLSATMPGLFVVPSSLSDAFLKDAIHQYNNNRLPIWCYTHPNKCSLLRSSNFREESVQFQVDQKIRQEITKCDPSGRKIRVMDLNKLCPTLQQVQMSFHKLKTSCMPANEEDYMEIDGKWYSTLQTIKWLQYISCCLDVTRSCVDHINNGLGTILLVEQLGVDWTACISCLVQVIIDPTKRTIQGISELIQREWIIGCHPFTTRLGTLYQPKKTSKFQSESSDDGEMCKSPIFLLFLDCLYQILAQQSTKVEYTSFFLTSLADGTRLPVFDSFIFNNERERNRTLQQLNQQGTHELETISIWEWNVQYNHQIQQLFVNPLYKCKRFHHLVAPITLPLAANSLATNAVMTSPNITTNPKMEKMKSSTKTSSHHHRSASDSTCLDTTTSSPMTSSSHSSGHKRINSTSYEVPYQPPQGRSVFYCAGDERPDSGRSAADSRSSSTDNMATDNDEAVVIGLVDQVNLEDSRAPQAAERLRFTPSSANNNNDVMDGDDDVINMKTGVQHLRFWKFAYLRWVSFSQLIGGGESPVLQQENKMADQIEQLACKIEHLEAQLSCNDGTTVVTSPPPKVDDVTVPFMSSYFPYLAISDKCANKSTLGRVYNFSSRKKEGKSSASSAPSPKIHHNHISSSSSSADVKTPHRPAPLTPSSHHKVALSESQSSASGVGTYNRLSSGL